MEEEWEVRRGVEERKGEIEGSLTPYTHVK